MHRAAAPRAQYVRESVRVSAQTSLASCCHPVTGAVVRRRPAVSARLAAAVRLGALKHARHAHMGIRVGNYSQRDQTLQPRDRATVTMASVRSRCCSLHPPN
jgi:hypothetical protein